MTVKQASVRLGVSSATVYGLCAARQLRYSRVGLGRGKIVISEEAIAGLRKAIVISPAQFANLAGDSGREPIPGLSISCTARSAWTAQEI